MDLNMIVQDINHEAKNQSDNFGKLELIINE
jgi:hypothetical protein